MEVIKVKWTEHERGWGQRPDGCSYHLTSDDAEKFIKRHWSALLSGPVPVTYSDPESKSIVSIDDDLYQMVKQSNGGLRSYD